MSRAATASPGILRMAQQPTIDLVPPTEKAFLVAVDTGEDAGWTAEDWLAELASLPTPRAPKVVGAEWQNRRHVDPNWYVGKGKAEELVAAKAETGFNLLIADDELSPNQQKALEGCSGSRCRPKRPDPGHLRPAARPTRAASRSSWPS